MKFSPSIVLLLAGLTTSLPAITADKPNLYSVEVIAFLHLDSSNREAETWTDERHYISLDGIDPLFAPTAHPSLPFQQRKSGQFSLADAARRLSRSGNFEPLIHKAWIQPSFPRKTPRSVGFKQWFAEPGKGNSAQSKITGIVNFSAGRFLHISTDFVYRQWLGEETVDPLFLTNSSGEFTSPSTGELNPAPVPQLKLDGNPWDENSEEHREILADIPVALDEEPVVRAKYQDYRLTEERRIRLNEVHYFDHPAFGVLVKVERYEATPFRPKLEFAE